MKLIDCPKECMWGGSSITEKDWEFISTTIKKYNIKKVLEFGCGLSTILMSRLVDKIISCEHDKNFANLIKEYTINTSEIILYKDKEISIKESNFDLIFLDGPGNGREQSFEISAATNAEYIIVHDAGRKEETQFQDQYLSKYFDRILDGGTRCRLWRRKILRKSNSCDVRIISTARGWGGSARSITTIMKMLTDLKYSVEFVPFHYENSMSDGIGREFRTCLSNELSNVIVRGYDAITEYCAITVVYSDDYVWEFGRPDLQDIFSNLDCDRKVFVVNYRIGSVGDIEWTKNWDKYLFLNSEHESTLINREPGAKTKVLAPCTDLKNFFEINPVFDNLKLIRHSSQGDFKFDKNNVQEEINNILACRNDLKILMMPGPSVVESNSRFQKFKKNNPPINQFLSNGNLFYYSLPDGFVDAGPRVILEAMAAGLPVIADNWGGAKDRIVPGTGWLCDNKEQYIEIVKNVTMEQLEEMGSNARQHALDNFVPERWIEEILSESVVAI